MSRRLDIQEMRSFAQDCFDMLDRQELPDTAAATQARAAVAAAARELAERADSPVSIGVVGEFTVGKSLLLGTLLGRPALLPVEHRPTTGNVTVLRLSKGRPGSRTQTAETAEVRFLDEAKLGACVRAILDALAASLVDLPQLGGDFLTGYDPLTDPVGWARFDAWIPRLWGRMSPDGGAVAPEKIGPTRRRTALELCRLRDAYLNQKDLLGGSIDVGMDMVRQALDLPPVGRLPDQPPRRESFPALTREKARCDAQILQRAAPLIERVTMAVQVSPEHWPLDELLADHDVQLIDFPGIDAASSGVRDAHLSRRELVAVHTILVVLWAGRTETAGGQEFWDMLVDDQRSREALKQAALVAVNGFDKVVLPSLPSGPLTVAVLGRHSSEINGAHAFAHEYVGEYENRIAAVSSLTAIKHYGLPLDGFSAETRNRIDDDLARLPPPGTEPWEDVATRLEHAAPGNPWTPRLRDFDADGGIKGLRRLIEDHVRTHGLAQKQERADRSKAKLDVALKALRWTANSSTSGAWSATWTCWKRH